MKETQWILVIFDWHPHRSDKNAPAVHAELCLVASGHIFVKVFTDVWSIVEHGHNWT